jgi:hypothetical protein
MERGSWLLIERGMPVRGAGDGNASLGTVAEVIGEEGTDIFRGVTLSTGRGRGNLFVPEDRIRAVDGGAVFVDLDPAHLDELAPAGESPATGTAA